LREKKLQLKIQAMENRIVVTITDHQRLMGLMEFASLKVKTPEVATRLYNSLCGARMVRQEQIDNKIITMNSRVRLKDLKSAKEAEITVTYPGEAEPHQRRVSVFSEIGVALLGRREREIVNWKVPGGVGTFEIIKVTYQPEAAGDYNL
jgi:regulator of nucleoside diphosphate kinase